MPGFIAPRSSNEDYWRKRLANQGSISAPPRSVERTTNNGLFGLFKVAGMSERSAQRLANRATAALRDLSPVGTAVDVQEGSQRTARGVRQRKAGETLAGVAQLAMAVIPNAPKKVVQRAAGPLKQLFGIRAWHGSPHDFDKFDASKIGTGDGAQSYGSGLYFAEQKDVAEFHRRPRAAPDGGHLYEVEIKAEPSQFLDWHSPTAPTGAELYTGLANQLGKYPGDLNGRRAASEELAKRGVPGVKYKDWWDRPGEWAGTHNYTVFDPSLIDILKKY